MLASINTLSLQHLPEEAPLCCLHDAVVHTRRDSTSAEEDALFLHGNYIASVSSGAPSGSWAPSCSRNSSSAVPGDHLKVDNDGLKLPFGNC
jgi:hypothetical protein